MLPRLIYLRRWRGHEVSVLQDGARRELWIDDEWQGAYAPGATARGWYWPLMAAELGRAARAQADPPALLCMGLGAGTVPRLLARAGYAGAMRAVEINPAVIEAAGWHLDLPDALQVIRADGAAYARARGARFSLIAEDIYAQATQLRPDRRQGLDAGYFSALWRNRLAPGGVLLVNLFSGDEFAPERAALRAELRRRLGPFTVLRPRYGANELWRFRKKML
jgi:spermidine synthase